MKLITNPRKILFMRRNGDICCRMIIYSYLVHDIFSFPGFVATPLGRTGSRKMGFTGAALPAECSAGASRVPAVYAQKRGIPHELLKRESNRGNRFSSCNRGSFLGEMYVPPTKSNSGSMRL